MEPDEKYSIVRPLVFEIDNVSTQKVVDTIIFKAEKYSYKDTAAMIKDAMAQCTIKHKIDILVSPAYYIYRKGYDSDYVVIISGFPGYYKKIRSAEPEDKWMFDFYEHKLNSADGGNK